MEFKNRNSWINYLLINYALILTFISSSWCQKQQKFRLTPQDLQVLEGSEATLKCEISNLAGQVQWTKDGFALGFSAVIPGFPRYSVLGDRNQGIYNLRISNASIDDDAEYQCQVGPGKFNSPIRANAKLTVICTVGFNSRHGCIKCSTIGIYDKNGRHMSFPNINCQLRTDKSFRSMIDTDHHKEISHLTNLPINMIEDIIVADSLHLFDLAPPSSIEIQGYQHNSKVEVTENKDLTLTCIVSNAKPAAQIVWYRGNVEYKPENREEPNVEETQSKRFTTTSRLRLKPTATDDYTEYSCQARQKALPPDMPMKASVHLSVLYPPGPPYIEGYTQGETLRRGQQVELVCRSRGGNPPAQLIWYQNKTQVRMAYRTSGRLSENIYKFVAEPSHNKKIFRCEANNVMSPKPLSAEVELTVLFAPEHVTITGPTEARVGDIVALTCTTEPSNPPAEIKWMVNGKNLRNTTSKKIISPQGGWITTSNITTTVEPHGRTLMIHCHAQNHQVSANVGKAHSVSILLPPSPPIISGYIEGSIIPAGTVQKLLCVSAGGNPLATLTWYKNDKKINSANKQNTDKSSVSGEITIYANVTDNQARYRCEAHNAATEIPLFESRTLNVHFPPETVKIRIEPEELKPGTEATLICDSSSSNPPSKVSWWQNGIPVTGINNSSKPGLWGGTVSTLELKVNVTQEMNGIVYTCQSTNEALDRSVHEAVSLQVLYPPKFQPLPSALPSVGVEGESLQVTLTANANPMSIQYLWTKDGLPILSSTISSSSSLSSSTSSSSSSSSGSSGSSTSANSLSPTVTAEHRITADGPVLNFTKLHRNDAGIYTCEASNSQGKATINITVVVEYGTTIKSVSENVVVNPGEDAMLSCTVEGNPLKEDHIKWERLGYDMTIKTSKTFANGTSFLHIKGAQREDVGNFRCVADNRVANPTNRDVLLIVKFSPEIDKSPPLLRAASGTGERARLPCRAQSAPKPVFIWRQQGKDIPVNKSSKYSTEEKQIDPLTYESILIVEKVAPADYGTYECIAKNELGKTKETVRLDITSPPDPPLSLNVLNVTHDSVTVGWTPGFDGGMKASYRIRYREANNDQYRYIDGLPNSHKLTIQGLRMNTLYLFSVMASNELGSSNYLPDLTRAHTKVAEIPPRQQPASSLGGGPPATGSTPLGGTSGMLVLVGIASGTFIVLVNIFIIGCCLHKRNQKRIIKRGHQPMQAELEKLEKSEMPHLVIIGIALAALGLLLVNAALVAWFVVKKRNNNKDTSTQNSKTATIEMYAPSSYNDTVTGETLSSVSEKSDSYSNEGSQPDYMDETRKKAASTYLVENSDIPPPRYQKDGTLPNMYPNNIANARTLPHPRHNNNASHMFNDHRTRDDQMLVTKGTYIPSPSPAPPMDGSYYNMNSDRYLSYPPMDYPPMEFSTPPLPLAHLQPNQTQLIPTGGGTLRRGQGIIRNVVPPPDVTHHTTPIPSHHDLHPNSTTASTQTVGNGSAAQISNLSSLSQISATHQQTSTPKQPQSILKDPKRNLQQQQQQQQQLQQQLQQTQQGSQLANMQILNVQNVGPTGLLIGNYDPNTHNLSTFNATMGYTDADGHLV